MSVEPGARRVQLRLDDAPPGWADLRPRCTPVEWLSNEDAPPPSNAEIGDEWQRGLARYVLTGTGWETHGR